MTFNSSKSFTLVEMLIVFVVLGVLFSALIPRILVTQMKARNTSRVTALSQIHMGLRLHYLDNFFFPAELGLLVGSYLTSIPVDPSVKTISPCRAPYTDRTAFYNPA